MKQVCQQIITVFLITAIVFEFSGCRSNQKVIHLATKPMTEQYILGEMLRQLIEDETDIKVEITQGIGGGTSNIHAAMLKGEIDLYPEYTGTAWLFVLKEENIPDEETLYQELCQKYIEKYGFRWIGLYGFNNTYGLAIRKEIADKYQIKTYSDLSTYTPNLIFGAEYDFFERDDGYKALCNTYDYRFKKTVDLDIGLKYQAISNGKTDVIVVFNTDGQLSISDIAVLEDDKKFYPSYYCGTVVREEVLKQYPELESVLMKMDGILSDAEMSNLNYQVEAEGKDERKVASDFLKEKGLL